MLDHYISYTAYLMETEGQFGGRTPADLEILWVAHIKVCPTRLLDWTLDPFIALYFALTGFWQGGDFNAGEPSRLWVMILKNENERKDRIIHLGRKHQEDDLINKIIHLDVISNGGNIL